VGITVRREGYELAAPAISRKRSACTKTGPHVGAVRAARSISASSGWRRNAATAICL